jgi:hypothetical protein
MDLLGIRPDHHRFRLACHIGAGVDGCVAAACDAGAAACALTQTPLAASSKAIAPAAQHGNQNGAFLQ